MSDRVLGGLLGVAAGDALGSTVEFRSPEWIAAEYGVHSEIVGGGVFGWRPGQGTDDTDLTAAVARGYASGYDLDAIAARFLAWHAGRPRGVGRLTARALDRLAEHGDPRGSGAAVNTGDDAGNGSLMRAIPTALARANRGTNSARRAREAAEISAITHSDQRCVEACQVYVEVAAALLAERTVDAALDAAKDLATHPAVVEALAVDPTRTVDTLRTGGYVIDSLTAAIWAVRQPASLEELLIAVVNRGDDADTTGAIVGGLLGVRDGAGAIPTRWLDKLKYRDELVALARDL